MKSTQMQSHERKGTQAQRYPSAKVPKRKGTRAQKGPQAQRRKSTQAKKCKSSRIQKADLPDAALIPRRGDLLIYCVPSAPGPAGPPTRAARRVTPGFTPRRKRRYRSVWLRRLAPQAPTPPSRRGRACGGCVQTICLRQARPGADAPVIESAGTPGRRHEPLPPGFASRRGLTPRRRGPRTGAVLRPAGRGKRRPGA